MAKIHIQVPADLHLFATLLGRLFGPCGPMKAADLHSDGRVEIWFVPGNDTNNIVKAIALLKRGELCVAGNSPRRVYTDIVVCGAHGEWSDVTADHYTAAGLLQPAEYGWPPEVPEPEEERD